MTNSKETFFFAGICFIHSYQSKRLELSKIFVAKWREIVHCGLSFIDPI